MYNLPGTLSIYISLLAVDSLFLNLRGMNVISFLIHALDTASILHSYGC